MIYTVRKGKHSSGCRFRPYWSRTRARAIVQFTPSCRYDLDYSQINKVFGLSWGLFGRDSARFGWKSLGNDSDMIQLWAYMHEGGEIQRGKGRANVPINTDVELVIDRMGRDVLFTVNGTVMAHYMFDKAPPRYGWRQWFYFGGRVPAPHNVSILMDLTD